MEVVISIENFEGPLDLMLHLIKEKQLDLFNLDVRVLCDQYLDFINRNKEMGLEISGEYLSELASLIETKSYYLLPKRKNQEETEEDPKEKLISRLIEYQRFKDVSKILDEYQNERNMQFTKPLSFPEEVVSADLNDTIHLKGNPYDLMKAMNRVLRRVALNTVKETTFVSKEYNVMEMAEKLKEKYEHTDNPFSLYEEMQSCENKMEAVAVFLAVLDLINQKHLIYTVGEEDIYLKWSVKYA